MSLLVDLTLNIAYWLIIPICGLSIVTSLFLIFCMLSLRILSAFQILTRFLWLDLFLKLRFLNSLLFSYWKKHRRLFKCIILSIFFLHDIGNCLFNVVDYFFRTTSLPKSWGNTYVALIPKKNKPKVVSDFRPISLCNVCYKITAKILANRLRTVFPNLIGREQSGFIAGHCPIDNIFAVQEIAHSIEHDYKNPSLGW